MKQPVKEPGSFSQTTINILAKRAGQICSNPGCRRHTSGGHSEDNKAVVVGEATHIYGQKPGSARYDPRMTDQEKSDISNGIWLCGNCHKMIDSDEVKFPARLLLKWKYEHEGSVLQDDSSKRNNTVIQALLNELKENIIVANNVLDKGNYSVKMSNESWNISKGEIGFMAEGLQNDLIHIYSLISDFNGLIEYDLYKLSHGAGYKDEEIRRAATTFRENVNKIIKQLNELK